MTPSISKPAGMIRRTERATRIAVALAGAVLTVGGGQMALLRLGGSLVSLSYDMPFLVHRPGTADDLRIVYLDRLDGDSLDRRPQARLLDQLGKAGAKTAVYDLIFDRESADPDIDREFAAAIRRFRGVDADGRPVPGMPRRHVLLACGRKSFNRTGNAGDQLIAPTDELLDAADDFGLVAVNDDAFIIRKLGTGTRYESSLIWKAAQAVGAGLDESQRLQPRWLNFAGPPPPRGGRRSNEPIPSCGARRVLAGGFEDGFFRDKIVVIGGAPGVAGEALGKDLFGTPFHRLQVLGHLPLMSGVEVQANGLGNLIHRNWLTRSGDGFDFAMIIVAGVVAGAAFSLLRPLRAAVAAGALVLTSMAAGVLAMHYGRFWFPWTVVAFLQAPVALVWGIAAHSYIERFFRIRLTAEQAAMRAAFAKYLSPQMLDRLTAAGFHTNLGGEKIEVAMMFTDIESFTDMCERIGSPQRVVETLNDYFERTTGSIFDCDGVIIKYIGDAISAAWGAPQADPLAPVKAVRAAWRLHECDRLVVDGVAVKTRIGLHLGEVVAGNIGSARRVDYTLIGDAVDLAARLEGLNKMFATRILMSGALHARLDGEFLTRRVATVRVKGRRQITTLHELLGPAGGRPEPAWIALYEQALAALEGDDHQTARDLFAAVNRARGPDGDGPSGYFLEQLKSGDLIPGGIIEIKEK